MKCPRCQQDNPSHAKFCLRCGTPVDGAASIQRSYPDLSSEIDRLKGEIEGLRRSLGEAVEQQTATSEILRVISGSPSDVAPIFDTLAESAWRLCAATHAAVYRFDGALVHFVAHHGYPDEALAIVRTRSPSPPDRSLAVTRAILDRTVVHIPDVFEDTEHRQPDLARAVGVRSLLSVPMLHDGKALGAIVVGRGAPGPFSEGQIALLQTFADQAVIAIENVRMFNETKDALERQTATSEILRVISSSPTDLQPVFDTIAERAVRLCDAAFGAVLRFDGEWMNVTALKGLRPDEREFALRAFPRRPKPGGPGLSRVVLTGEIAHIPDVQSDPAWRWGDAEAAFSGVDRPRTFLAVPLIREGLCLGAVNVWRREPSPFSEQHIELLKTFADQAVIAIENVRLFNETKDALERQTATSEILQVISRSPTDFQPVFDTIVRHAGRVCNAFDAVLVLVDGDDFVQRAHSGPIERAPNLRYPLQGTVGGRAILEARVIQVENLAEAVDYPIGQALAQRSGYRTTLSVPLPRDGAAIGAITIRRTEVLPFSDKQIDLLQTFADQAVIAIENVRLFTELRERTAQLGRSVDELTALGQVSQALSSTLDLGTVLTTIVGRAIELSGAEGGSVYEYDDAAEEFRLRATRNFEEELVEASRAMPLRGGALGMVAERREPIQFPDISDPTVYQSAVRDVLLRTGYRAVLALPLLCDDRLVGALVLGRKSAGEFAPGVMDLLTTFANQSTLAVHNARLFREIAEKSRQLEAASRHKPEFLANMSHELRTPLNAVIGFSEVLLQRMFGDLNAKQDEYLKDIYASGQHLLSLINDILDLSKIEAGRMELEAAEFDLPSAIDNALTLVRERATRRGITLGRTVDDRLGMLRGDERKVKQVLLNLLSNALKFTPEGGRIDVSAHLLDGAAEIAVADTGVGIAPEDQEAIFEEFRQVGTADKKVEGTGLGLALSRKFIELHGGRIWVKSEVGNGSTFRFALPLS